MGLSHRLLPWQLARLWLFLGWFLSSTTASTLFPKDLEPTSVVDSEREFYDDYQLLRSAKVVVSAHFHPFEPVHACL